MNPMDEDVNIVNENRELMELNTMMHRIHLNLVHNAQNYRCACNCHTC
jgi:hypothetical protein